MVSSRDYRAFAVAICLLLASGLLGQQKVTVFARASPPLTKGGSPALQTALGAVSAITTDHAGAIYFADATQSLLMKVTPDGTLSVIGGNGSFSSTAAPQGDGGPAVDAPISAGYPIALDDSGNLFVVDYNRIRKITTDGIVHAIFEGSQQLPFGSGYQSNEPWFGFFPGLTVDSQGRVFFSELPGAHIWRLDASGTLTLIAGNGTYGLPAGDGGQATHAVLGEPHGIVLDADGNLYLADARWGTIRKVNAADGTITTIAGGGNIDFRFNSPVVATSAVISDPESMAFDAQGNLVLLSGFPQLASISPGGMISLIQTGQAGGFSGDGGAVNQAQFQSPASYTSQFAIDDLGNILVPDSGNGRIRKIDTAGIVTTLAGNENFRFAGDGGQAANARLSSPNYVSFGSAGELYVSDSGNHRVRRITPDEVIQTVVGNGETYFAGSSPLISNTAPKIPVGVSLDAATGAAGGGCYYSETNFIRQVDVSGHVTTVAAGVGDADGLAVGPDGRLYFTGGSAVLVVNPDGTFTSVAGQFGINGYAGIGQPRLDALLGAPRGLAFGFLANAVEPSGGRFEIESVPRNGLLPVRPAQWPKAPSTLPTQ